MLVDKIVCKKSKEKNPYKDYNRLSLPSVASLKITADCPSSLPVNGEIKGGMCCLCWYNDHHRLYIFDYKDIT